MADLTPEQQTLLRSVKNAALGGMFQASAVARGEKTADAAYQDIQTMAEEITRLIIEAGWRAPGPPTEEEVERAARANIDPRTDPSDVERRRARAALTAALGGLE